MQGCSAIARKDLPILVRSDLVKSTIRGKAKNTIKPSDAKQQQIYSRLWCSEGFVNKTDDYADDSPLDEVSRSLSQSESQPHVQLPIAVQHSCTNPENTNEIAEALTFRNARPALVNPGQNYSDNQDRYESSD